MSDTASRSRSRSPRKVKKERKPLDEQALERLVAIKLAKWLAPESEEIKLLAQFCATMAHSEENWKMEIKEEVESFLGADSDDFISWLDKYRWEDDLDAKFGKAALKLKQRVLEEASGKTPQQQHNNNRNNRDNRQKGAGSATGGHGGRGPQHHNRGTPLQPANHHHMGHQKVNLIPRRGEDLETVQIGFGSTSSTLNSNKNSNNSNKLNNKSSAPKIKISPSMAVAEWDNSKEEYQNLTLDNEQSTDRAEQRRVLDAGRKKMLEQNTKLLQRVLLKLNDPNNTEKQKEQLAAMISKIKSQMAAVKPLDPRTVKNPLSSAPPSL